jgi:RNA polymerase sigma-70 factor (ECF subfamily)
MNVPDLLLVWTGTMTATRTATGQEGRFRTLTKRGDGESPGATWFRTLGRPELDRAYRLAGFILADAREAEDATQDALIRAWRQRRSLRRLESAQAWFDRILVNVCRDRLRRRRPSIRWTDVDADAGAPFMATDPFAAMLARDAILRALSTLSPDHRIVLVLRFWADLPVEAIAERLHVPAGTVKSRLHYATQALRDALERST